MRRTAIAALCLITATTLGATGCLSSEDKADKSSKSGKTSSPSSSGKSKKSAKSGSDEPFPGLTGGQIANRAVEATTGASSLRVTGDVPDEASGGTIGLDMALNKQNECAGTLSMDGGKADLIKTGDTIYLRYDEAFLRAQGEGQDEAETDAVVDLLAGKWAKTSATGDDAAEMTAFCDLNTLLGGAEDVHSAAERGETTTVDGTPAITLTEKNGADRYTLYVATEDEPYLLRVDSTSTADPSTLAFRDYEKPVPAREPAGEIIDLDELAA
jgi:hypothetical protein